MKNKKYKNQELQSALIEKLEEFRNEILPCTGQIIDCYLCSTDAKALNKYINWTHTSERSPYKVGILKKFSDDKVKFMVLLSPELNYSKFILRQDPNKLIAPYAIKENPIEKLKRDHADLVQEAYKSAFTIPGGKNNGEID